MKPSDWLDSAEARKILKEDSDLADVASSMGAMVAGELLDRRALDGFAPADYWKKLCHEFRKMICDDNAPEYAAVREKAREAYQAGKLLGLPILCAVLAKQVGLAEAIITPFVALLIQTGVTVNVEAWCSDKEIPNVKVDVNDKKEEEQKAGEKNEA